MSEPAQQIISGFRPATPHDSGSPGVSAPVPASSSVEGPVPSSVEGREAGVVTAGPCAQNVSDALRAIRFARFRFHLRAEEALRLPAYSGSMFRGGFGHAFKRAVCVMRHGDCDGCLVRYQCPYQYVFETPPPPGSEILRKYPAAPHPFVMEPPLDGRQSYASGDCLELGLTLIGRGIDYLPYFIVGFEELGRSGLGKAHSRFRLTEVLAESRNGGPDDWMPIYSGDQRSLRDDFRIRTGRSEDSRLNIEDGRSADAGGEANLESSILNLQFVTPTRLKFGNHLTSDLEFHILIRNLLRRLSALSYFHCGRRLDLDFRGLVQRAEHVETISRNLRWVDWERYSARQQTTMFMGGFVGSATFRGPLADFVPFLRLGQYVHIGKGAVFGLGQYRVRIETLD